MLETYIAKFSKLKQDGIPERYPESTNSRAPHKPLLLLAVLDLFAEGAVTANLIEPSLELGELFTLYWARVMPPAQRGNWAMPFSNLKRDGFWRLMAVSGREDYVASVPQFRSVNALREAVKGAQLDEELYALLRLQPSRDALRRVLIETYFTPQVQVALTDQGVINTEAYLYSEGLLNKAKDKLVKEGLSDDSAYRPAARDQGFRRAIIGAYNHTCAFCGLRVLTPDGHTAADAAHIVPWSQTHNDAIENGLALCKLCHWGFDEGLLMASAKYAVMTSSLLNANYNIPAHLPALKGKLMSLPSDQAFWPDLEALKQHRERFQRTR